MPPRPLALTEEARTELEDLRDHGRRPYLRARAAALLKLADGEPVATVAARGLLRRRKRDTVAEWRRRYDRDGVAGLVQLPRGHRGFSPSDRRRSGGDGAS